eukprot:10092216-Alexandrium_andersonii.AAC.1
MADLLEDTLEALGEILGAAGSLDEAWEGALGRLPWIAVGFSADPAVRAWADCLRLPTACLEAARL